MQSIKRSSLQVKEGKSNPSCCTSLHVTAQAYNWSEIKHLGKGLIMIYMYV